MPLADGLGLTVRMALTQPAARERAELPARGFFDEIATAIGLGKTRTNELIGELIISGHVVAEGATGSRRYRLADG